MEKKHVLVVFGTRPEAIKMCPLVNELKKSAVLRTTVCVTGQHREMLHQVLETFSIREDYDLDIMQKEQDLYDVTGRVLAGMRDVLKKEQPDAVLVHGDTSTAFAASLAAFYRQIPTGHVEAGCAHTTSTPPIRRSLTGRPSPDGPVALCAHADSPRKSPPGGETPRAHFRHWEHRH